jgi:hypothetical protein
MYKPKNDLKMLQHARLRSTSTTMLTIKTESSDEGMEKPLPDVVHYWLPGERRRVPAAASLPGCPLATLPPWTAVTTRGRRGDQPVDVS